MHRTLSIKKTNAKRSRCRTRMWDGLLECSLALEMVPAEARLQIAGQRAGIIPWVGYREGGKGSEMDIRATCTYFKNLSLRGPENLTGADDPRHALQEKGGFADFFVPR